MGVYGDQVLPRIINKACGMKANAGAARAGVRRPARPGGGDRLRVRARTCPTTPPRSPAVAAVEPADLGWKLAGKRLAAASVPVERTGLDGQSLPLPDDSCDTALSTWTLCTIPDVAAALQEVRRVLKPGGTLHFVEHGLAPDEKVQRWQHRLEPMQKRLFGGCHLTRPHRRAARPTRASRSPRSTSSTRRGPRSSSPPRPLGVAVLGVGLSGGR